MKLTVCRRANKTMTLVDNLDTYGIPATDFSHQIQKQAACHSAGGVFSSSYSYMYNQCINCVSSANSCWSVWFTSVDPREPSEDNCQDT